MKANRYFDNTVKNIMLAQMESMLSAAEEIAPIKAEVNGMTGCAAGKMSLFGSVDGRNRIPTMTAPSRWISQRHIPSV